MRSKGLASFGQTLAENVDSAKIHGAVAQKPQLHTFLELYLRLNAMGSRLLQLGSSPRHDWSGSSSTALNRLSLAMISNSLCTITLVDIPRSAASLSYSWIISALTRRLRPFLFPALFPALPSIVRKLILRCEQRTCSVDALQPSCAAIWRLFNPDWISLGMAAKCSSLRIFLVDIVASFSAPVGRAG